MPSFLATRLLDFDALRDGWIVRSLTYGANGDLIMLLAEPVSTDSTFSRSPSTGRFRILHLLDGQAGGRITTLDLSPLTHELVNAHHLGDGDWLLWYEPSHRAFDEPNALVIDCKGELIRRFRIGSPWKSRVSETGRLWAAFEETQIFGSGLPAADGLVAVDATGQFHFRWRRDAMRSGIVDTIWSVAGLNVVSDHEVWLSLREWRERPREQPHIQDWIARLIDGDIDHIWPWTDMSDKCPVQRVSSFAVATNRLLAQGTGSRHLSQPPSPNRDRDRLYLVSLDSPRSLEVFPVDEAGSWIGDFSVEGRGSLAYLRTDESLFVIDAAGIDF